ncbi:MAG: hypothetical protein JO348_01475 [Alphaproteobacteria bacterium]|nr:hypothetical protein [Alphaproteobacteria bacterium]MBV9904193.1 hypothetical protein [Alphaproteobacteria bacterium]
MAQTTAMVLGTPVYAIHEPKAVFRNTPVKFVTGDTFAHVVNVATDDAGHAKRLEVSLVDIPGQTLWLDESSLVYSRARNIIIAYDVRKPALAVASAN